jgi:hypothetical protein
LGEFLLPTYRYTLTEQFRLHSAMARPIWETLYQRWIHTQPRSDILTVPQLGTRLQWQDIRSSSSQSENPWEGNRVLKFLSALGRNRSEEVGILIYDRPTGLVTC